MDERKCCLVRAFSLAKDAGGRSGNGEREGAAMSGQDRGW